VHFINSKPSTRQLFLPARFPLLQQNQEASFDALHKRDVIDAEKETLKFNGDINFITMLSCQSNCK